MGSPQAECRRRVPCGYDSGNSRSSCRWSRSQTSPLSKQEYHTITVATESGALIHVWFVTIHQAPVVLVSLTNFDGWRISGWLMIRTPSLTISFVVLPAPAHKLANNPFKFTTK